MSSVNYGAIMAKVDAYIQSPECKARANETAERYIDTNRRTTDAGSHVLTKAEMLELAQQLVIIVEGMANGRVAPSVSANISSLTPGGVVKTGLLNYEIDMSFSGDLSRPSLDPGYGGVYNIIALMNNGYNAPNARFIGGYWNGVYINARPSRPALGFMEAAVDSFNAAYGGLGIHAELTGPY